MATLLLFLYFWEKEIYDCSRQKIKIITNLKIIINTKLSKTEWIQFIEQKRYKNQDVHPDSLEIDFNPSSFIEPFYLVSLACMIEEYSINGTEISFSSFDNWELYEYLLSGRFFNYWEKEFDRYENYFKHPKSTMLRLWKIESKAITEYVDHAQKMLRQLIFHLQNYSIM